MQYPDFPQWLRQRRKLLDLTQSQLALQVGVSVVTIRKMEAGERKPSKELASLLALALHLPEREHAAFIHFARADEVTASLPLPAWDADVPAWRRGGLPPAGPPASTGTIPRLTLHYDLFPLGQISYHRTQDGSQLTSLETAGPVHGELEGRIHLRITQWVKLKPPGFDFSLALPSPLGVLFKVVAGEEALEGSYTGTFSPALDTRGGGEARIQGTGRILAVSAGFAEFFLNYVFVEDVVKIVEGQGTGARGVMYITPAQ